MHITFFLVLLVFLLAPGFTGAQESEVKISSPEEIKEDFSAVPCNDKERLEAVKALFERAGAPASDVSSDKYRDVENFVVMKKGESDERIVIGAHYDKVSDGCGALDNWTGIVAMSHVYRTLKNFPLKKNLVFVAFGKEEKGLVGSRAMTNAIGKDQATQYCAMINIDSLGMSPPQVADNLSSKKLAQLAADLAKEMKIPFSHANIAGGSDSTSFMSKNIPAATIHGLDNNWPTILHTRNDQVTKVNPVSVYLGYRLVLAMISRLDQSLCDAFR